MEFIRSERLGRIQVMTLSRGKANAIHGGLVEELDAAVAAAAADDAVRGLVLASDRPKFFSGGFDAGEVFAYDRQGMDRFFGRFLELYERLFRLPKPVGAALSGHAYAGGAVLALTADVRLMAEGEFGFALNEVNLGLAFPEGIIRMAIAAVGLGRATELLLAGRTLSPEQAGAIGLAHEVVPQERLLERTLARVEELADKPPLTFAAIKRALRAEVGYGESFSDRHGLDRFLDHWFSPEAQERKEALRQSLRR